MRELKFRAWQNFGKYMMGNDELLDHGDNLLVMLNDTTYYTAMQYTGLKDKNGREIFEGDILDYKWKVSTRDLLIVEWSERDACFLMGGVRTDYAIAYGEVIGNIHENLELLGGASE